jgi:hypothetical protein
MRVGMSGMTGLDARSCLALLAARGINPEIAALFLPFWEAGMLEAVQEQRSEGNK